MRIEDALKNYAVDESTGCWIWKSSFTKQGYGQARINGRTQTMHRLFLESRIGAPIGRGLFACHRCNNRKCVNPDHLYAGTRKENAADAVSAGSYVHGESHPCSRISEADALEIISSNDTAQAIADRLGITRWTVFDIRKGRRWKHLFAQGHHHGIRKPRVRVKPRIRIQMSVDGRHG